MSNELQSSAPVYGAAGVPLVYSLVAYRPNGVDSCRGCVMARSDSDIALHFFSSQEKLTDAWAQLRLAELGTGYEVSAVEYTLLINGMDDDAWWRIHSQLNPEQEVDEAPFYELRELAEQKYQSLVLQEKQREQQAKIELERTQQLERERATEQARQAEKKLYEQLHQKYGSS